MKSEVNNQEELLTLSEVSELLKVHPNTLRNWDANGTLKSVRIGIKKVRRYRKADIDLFLRSSDEQ